MECFCEEGAKVVFCGRREEKGKAIEKQVRDAGYDAVFVKADMCVTEDVEHLIAETKKNYGTIDILVNNAGVLCNFDILNMDTEKDYDRVFDTNVKSYFIATKLAANVMADKGSGVIINTASIGGLSGGANVASYCASKAAVINFTRAMAKELGPKGIRTNSIAPGLIYSEMMPKGAPFTEMALSGIPLGRGGEPEEIGKAAVFLASDDAAFINGANLVIDGGASA